jgi:pimeloyl-ACP methyl ester carboxylesterase
MQGQMTTLAINGEVFTVARQGTGPAIVLVHGAVGDLRTWEDQLPRLSGEYEVIAYSRRGHYPATHIPPGTDYTVESHARDLIGLIQALGNPPVRLVGHSYGGAICAVVALLCPQLVRSLVLAEPSLFTLLLTQREGALALGQSAAAMTHVAPLIREGKGEQALDEYLDVILGPGGAKRITGFSRRVMLANTHTIEPMLNGMNNGQFHHGHASQIQVPTLILQGEQTPPFFRLTAETLANTIPGARHVVIPGVSHGLQLESPEAFSRAVLDFFAAH